MSNIELLSNQSFFKLAKNSFLAAEKIASELNYINDKIGLNITGLILYPIKITLDTVLLHSKLIQAANKKIKPVVIIGQHPEKIKYNNYLFINNEFPLLSYIAKKLSESGVIAAEFRSYKTQPLRSQSFNFLLVSRKYTT